MPYRIERFDRAIIELCWITLTALLKHLAHVQNSEHKKKLVRKNQLAHHSRSHRVCNPTCVDTIQPRRWDKVERKANLPKFSQDLRDISDSRLSFLMSILRCSKIAVTLRAMMNKLSTTGMQKACVYHYHIKLEIEAKNQWTKALPRAYTPC